jgi:hypothetical protein
MLKADPTDWLLEKDNPSVRYFTLIEIFDKPEDDSEVREAKDEIMKLVWYQGFWPSRMTEVIGENLRIFTSGLSTKE